ncbi:MAG: hypothetical protein HDT37_00565 [Clostridiales bacterium]|nr:hypothetical protein [Clostridiales bacterium]
MNPYIIVKIPSLRAKAYICEHHYSHGCHNRPSPCYGLYDGENLIGVCAFATPCSERVRSSVFGEKYKGHVTELHRLHILDCTPKNTESWFISRCLKLLKQEKPDIWAVISFSDLTVGHVGTIYKATNAYRLGTTPPRRFFIDETGRLRHPRQCGHNITTAEAAEMGWRAEMRESKNRYLWLLPDSKGHKRRLLKLCKYDLQGGGNIGQRTGIAGNVPRGGSYQGNLQPPDRG